MLIHNGMVYGRNVEKRSCRGLIFIAFYEPEVNEITEVNEL